jgi:hypothetical protein
MKILRTGGNGGNPDPVRDSLCFLLFKPAFHICVNLRDLRANAFLSEFAAVQQLRQLAA